MVACVSNKAVFTKVTEQKLIPSSDSVVNVLFKRNLVIQEHYSGNSVRRVKSYNEEIAKEYYINYYGAELLGVDLFENNCSSCHSWYPDFKNEHDYNTLDSTKYFMFFKTDSMHNAAKLTSIELLCIAKYLRIR